MHHLYTPFYCEENIWQLCQQSELQNLDSSVAIISNAAQAVLFFQQQQGRGAEGFVVWDYHVILLSSDQTWQVWDFESKLGFPCELGHYLEHSFPRHYRQLSDFQPMFRIIKRDEYVRRLRSDRSHMRKANGDWSATPPTWPPILSGDVSLHSLVDVQNPAMGEVVSLQSVESKFIEKN